MLLPTRCYAHCCLLALVLQNEQLEISTPTTWPVTKYICSYIVTQTSFQYMSRHGYFFADYSNHFLYVFSVHF